MPSRETLLATLLTISLVCNAFLVFVCYRAVTTIEQMVHRPVVVQLVPADASPSAPPQARPAPAPVTPEVPVILAPASAPPIKSAVPLPPQKPVVNEATKARKAVKHHKKKPVQRTLKQPAPVKWSCNDLPYYARDLSADTIRRGAKMQGYSDADVRKALQCLGKLSKRPPSGAPSTLALASPSPLYSMGSSGNTPGSWSSG